MTDPLTQAPLRVESVLHLEEGAQRKTGEGMLGCTQIRERLVDPRAAAAPIEDRTGEPTRQGPDGEVPVEKIIEVLARPPQ